MRLGVIVRLLLLDNRAFIDVCRLLVLEQLDRTHEVLLVKLARLLGGRVSTAIDTRFLFFEDCLWLVHLQIVLPTADVIHGCYCLFEGQVLGPVADWRWLFQLAHWAARIVAAYRVVVGRRDNRE